MKKRFVFIYFLFVFMYSFGTTPDDSTKQYIYAYQYDENFLIPSQTIVDTNLNNFHVYNPVYKNTVSSTYLGNLGLANQNNIFINRYNNDYLFLIPFLNYMHTADNITFYQTRKPFTDIKYTNGGSGTNLEQTISAIHTQNINKNINIGLKYNLYSSLGQYIYQKAKHNSFSLFSTFRKNKYSLFANASLNKLRISENGGIVSDSLLHDLEGRTSSVDVKLMNNSPGKESLAGSIIKNQNLIVLNKYTLTKYIENNYSDSLILDSITSAKFFSISHLLKVNNSNRNHYDNFPMSNYYNLITDSVSTNDSSYFRSVLNSLRFEIHETKNDKMPGIVFAVNHEWDKYSFRNFYYEDTTDHSVILSHGFHDYITINPPIKDPEYKPDTIYNYVLHQPVFNKYISNTSASVMLYKNMSMDIKWSLYGNYYLQGYKQNDYYIKGELFKKINKNANAKIKAFQKKAHPSYIYQQFSSDHYYWENNFESKMLSNLSLSYYNENFKFYFLASTTLLKNHIYLERDSIAGNRIIPKQIDDQILIFTSIIRKDIRFWNFHTNTQLVYQKLPGQYNRYLPLPEIICKNSTYFDRVVKFKVTKGELRFQLGFDLNYHSKYLAQDYSPALGMFYIQDENKEIGNYPFVDVFLNLRIKRARFFLKYEHVNSGFTGDEYFTALHYPMNWRVLKMGLSWRFDN